MNDPLATFLSIPSQYVRFALGAGPEHLFAHYISHSHVDWPECSEIETWLAVPNAHFAPLRREIYGLERTTFSVEELRASLEAMRNILNGRLQLIGARARIAVSEVATAINQGCQSF